MDNTLLDIKEEVTIRDIFISIRKWIRFFRRKWMYILIAFIVGGSIGFLFVKLSKTKYIATTTFIVDAPGGDVQTPSVLGSILGPGSSNPGLFAGDNLKWLYTSPSMLEKALLTPVPEKNNQLLVNWLIEIDEKLKESVKKVKVARFGSAVSPENMTLQQRAILKSAVGRLRKDYISVGNIESTTGVISVTVTSLNEHFSKELSDVLVNTVNSFYIATKTKKTAEQVASLEKKVAEYDRDINRSMYRAASAVESIPNANPNLQTIAVAPQREGVDIQVNSTLYSQMVAQLEAAKVALSKETPIIQIIDAPSYPLSGSKPSLMTYAGGGAILASVLVMMVLFGIRFYKETMAND